MTHNNLKIPLAALTGGAAALLLRVWNLRAGFEDATGLSVPGHPSFPAMALALVLTLAALIILSRPLRADANPAFPFRTGKRSLLTLPVTGAFLLTLSGVADMFEAFSGENLASLLRGVSPTYAYEYEFAGLIGGENVGMSAGVQCVCGLLTLISARTLFQCAADCLRGNVSSRAWITFPAVALAFRLVIMYRVDSVNPVLEDYAPVLLALVFQTLGFYALSAFPFEGGDLRRFAVYCGGAVSTALPALADECEYLSMPLTLAGSAAALTGFLLLALDAPPVTPAAPDAPVTPHSGA